MVLVSSLRQLMYLYELRNNTWKSPEELTRIQEYRFLAMVKYAYRIIPFYRKKFKLAGIKPDDIKNLNDITKIPFTTKDEIQNNFNSLISEHVNTNKCHISKTSGSTGTNFSVVYDNKSYDWERAVLFRANFECKQKLTDKMLTITSPFSAKIPEKWFQRAGILRKKNVSVLTPIDEMIKTINGYNPDIIYGYSSYLWFLAKELEDKAISNIQPRLVFGTAEILDRKMREDINSVFDTEMFDFFGCVELGRTAWECEEHSGYHMDVDSVVMEFIRDGKHVSPGERGEIVYTGLYNYAMPLIRYRSGDLATPMDEMCPCGRGLPMMKSIEGRKDDFIRTPNGKLYSPITLALVMKYKNEILNYRIVQEKINELNISAVGEEICEKTIEQIKQEIKDVLGQNFIINVEVVDKIPMDKSGKLRSVVSKII